MTTKKTHTLLICYKTFFALLGFSSLVAELVATIERGTYDPSKFFGYFTIQSNIIAFVILLVGAVFYTQLHKSVWFGYIRGAAALYMIITGVVFALLLSGIKDVHFTALPWDNIVLHYIMPVVMLLDWVMDRAPKLALQKSLLWIIYPLAYVVYTLLRGPMINWYPYPFLNPSVQNYTHIFATVAILLLFGCAVIYALCSYTKIDRLRKN